MTWTTFTYGAPISPSQIIKISWSSNKPPGASQKSGGKVSYLLQTLKIPKDIIHSKVKKTLHFVQLEVFEDRPATKLSGGQQQRVALTRALVAANPRSPSLTAPLLQYWSPDSTDIQLCRRRPLGTTVRPRHHNDLNLHLPGHHGNPGRHEIQAGGRKLMMDKPKKGNVLQDTTLFQ